MNHNVCSRLSSIDWDFPGDPSESPFSAIHFHPCRFVSQVPATLIGLLSKPGDLILDPFVGSGTTLVEAQRLGRTSVGIDLNPIAVLASKAKTIDKPISVIASCISTLKHYAALQLSRQINTMRATVEPKIPDSVQSAKWYVPAVADQLGRLWSLIQTLDADSRVIAECAFSAILLSVCRETRHWGYVCDNTMPQSNRQGDVLSEFCRALERLDRAYRDRDAEITASGRSESIKRATVIGGDAATVLSTYPKASVDLVLTSPPYFGVCDYIKAQRLSMEWFGITIEELRLKEIGARSKRHRGEALKEYVDGLTAVFTATRRCMKTGAYMALVIGESAKRAGVLSELRTMFQNLGFSLKMEINRTVSAQRRLAPSILGEHLFILSR
jgi:DNA modification methylase